MKLTVEAFIELKTKELRHGLRVLYGRHWRRIVARRMGRRDAPRFLVARLGKHRVTLAQLIPVEKLLAAARREILALYGLDGGLAYKARKAEPVEPDKNSQNGGAPSATP